MDVSKALAITLGTNHGLAYQNQISTYADAALAQRATQGPERKGLKSTSQ